MFLLSSVSDFYLPLSMIMWQKMGRANSLLLKHEGLILVLNISPPIPPFFFFFSLLLLLSLLNSNLHTGRVVIHKEIK